MTAAHTDRAERVEADTLGIDAAGAVGVAGYGKSGVPAAVGRARDTRRGGRWRAAWPDLRMLAPSLFALVNGLLFVLVRPDVNDLWAARARALAVRHDVGLTYWFGWFGGGTTPGNYSVVSPYLCAYLGTEVVGAAAALGVTVLVTFVVRGTRHPLAAVWVATLAAGVNLWSGRIAFLLGAAVAVAALIAIRHRKRVATVLLVIGAVLASPVAGAFLALGLAGTFLTTQTKQWRPIIAWAVGTAAICLVLVALAFGAPGPEPFSLGLAFETLGGLVLLHAARPPADIRTTIWLSALAAVLLWVVPNGMGSNFARFVWFCLPVAVVALSSRPMKIIAVLVAPLLLVGASTTALDLVNSAKPVSSTAYYQPLAARLDKIAGLENFRLEVVDHGAHAGYAALLTHALLARGWETQEDLELNRSLNQDPLPPVQYKVWLDNNAVGYVALPSTSVGKFPEYDLVRSGTATYLHRIWADEHWQLFRVADPTPIVAKPASVFASTQSSMTISIPCVCAVGVRVRWSKFLEATLRRPVRPGSSTAPAEPEVDAQVVDDGFGWTRITSSRPGTYVLQGNISGIVR